MKRGPLVVIIVLSVLVVALGSWLVVRAFFSPAPSVNSYAECVAAGYPILETYPEQCRTPDGRTFTTSDAPPQTPPPTPTPTGEFTSEGGIPITLDEWSGQPITSPLSVSGEVPGNWSFEASFPVRLTDEDGAVVAEAVAQLEGDWMTDEMVPFRVTLTFDIPPGGHGFLLLVKDNPSGLPEHDDSVSIPVTYS